MRLFLIVLLALQWNFSFASPSLYPRAPILPDTSRFDCKCVPGDRCWPSELEWKALNLTVGGRLKKAVPAAAVCYNDFEGKSYYNKAACDALIQNWTVQEALIATPLNPIRPYYSNMTCWPTMNPNEICTIGYLSSFYIATTTATAPQDISLAIKFARLKNIRFLVRNTGHDFMGRSVGYGSLAVNTHALKTVDFTKRYRGPGNYNGPAVTVGAGVQGAELYAQAFRQEPKVVVVGGECPTVGYAGGYLQGGGHGPLATIYGMGADQVLSFDAVTATGDLVTANANSNPDLYWALKGGGPSTYAVAYRMTVKTPPEVPCAGTIININFTHTTDSALFWKGVEAFHGLSNLYVDNGMFVYYELSELRLHIQPFVAPHMNSAQIKETLKPLFTKLNALNLPYDTVTKDFPTFYELYIDMFEGNEGSDISIIGGRFMSHTDVAQNSQALTDAFHNAIHIPNWPGGFIVGHIVGPGVGKPIAESSTHPKWRNASSFSITIIPTARNFTFAQRAEARNVVTNVVGGPLRAASPGGGAYVNEGDLNEPNWQTEYWGTNYPKLFEIRKKWDPSGVFYAETTPGTEKWSEVGDPPVLCKER